MSYRHNRKKGGIFLASGEPYNEPPMTLAEKQRAGLQRNREFMTGRREPETGEYIRGKFFRSAHLALTTSGWSYNHESGKSNRSDGYFYSYRRGGDRLTFFTDIDNTVVDTVVEEYISGGADKYERVPTFGT